MAQEEQMVPFEHVGGNTGDDVSVLLLRYWTQHITVKSNGKSLSDNQVENFSTVVH